MSFYYSVFDHISDNPRLLSHFMNASIFLLVTLANGSKIDVKEVGHVHLFPSFSLDSIIYIPHCPFNLVSISKLTHFFKLFYHFY